MVRKAFVIGANSDSLKSAESDAEKVRLALVEHGYILPNVDFSDLEAQKCISVLDEFIRDLKNDDSFIFYFVGHSFTDKNEVLLLFLPNSNLQKRSTCLSIPALLDSVQHCSALHKLIVLDSCQSASINKGINLNIPNLTTLTAADPWDDVPEIFDNSIGISGGLLSHFFHLALGDIKAVSSGRDFFTPSDFNDWMNDQIEKHDWKRKRIPRVHLFHYGNSKKIFKIASIQGVNREERKKLKQISSKNKFFKKFVLYSLQDIAHPSLRALELFLRDKELSKQFWKMEKFHLTILTRLKNEIPFHFSNGCISIPDEYRHLAICIHIKSEELADSYKTIGSLTEAIVKDHSAFNDFCKLEILEDVLGRLSVIGEYLAELFAKIPDEDDDEKLSEALDSSNYLTQKVKDFKSTFESERSGLIMNPKHKINNRILIRDIASLKSSIRLLSNKLVSIEPSAKVILS